MNSVSVVLPAFNEEGNLAATAADAVAHLERATSAWEIIIVNDGSTDRTNEIARSLCAENGRIRFISHSTNRGYGAALRSGFAKARHDFVFLTDADGQFSFAPLAGFLDHGGDFDAVIGRRTPRADAWYRLIISRIGNWFARAAFGICARDIDCAFKLFRRDALQALPLTCNGTMISTEILMRAARAGWRMREIPVPHRERTRGSNTGANPAIIWRTVVEFVRLRRTQGKTAPRSERTIPFVAPLPD